MKPFDLNKFNYKIIKSKNPWDLQIPCTYGHIYPYSNNMLGFYCSGYKIKAKIIRETDFELIQDGDTEGVFLFPPKRMKEMAKYAKPKSRRKMTAKQKADLAKRGREALEKYRGKK